VSNFPAPKPRGLVHAIIAAAADKLSQHASIPPENREAFRATAVSVIEQQICSVIGYDTVQLTGWIIPPSQRLAQRERIVAAIHQGERPRVIASRELVSIRTVERLRCKVSEQRQNTP